MREEGDSRKAALDVDLWQPNAAGGIGPAGWLAGAAESPSRALYAPLQDYHLEPPSIAPDTLARCAVVVGRSAILEGTEIGQHTKVLSTSVARLFSDEEWFAVVGRVAETSSAADVEMLYHPYFLDPRVAVFEFWWSSAPGRQDLGLFSAMASISAHQLAKRAFVGVLTATDDPAVVERYTVAQPLFKTPFSVLTELGRQDLVVG